MNEAALDPAAAKNALAFRQGLVKLQEAMDENAQMRARMAKLEAMMAQLQQKVQTYEALMGSGMYRAGTGSTVPHAD